MSLIFSLDTEQHGSKAGTNHPNDAIICYVKQRYSHCAHHGWCSCVTIVLRRSLRLGLLLRETCEKILQTKRLRCVQIQVETSIQQ
jgi:hypothetical protein